MRKKVPHQVRRTERSDRRTAEPLSASTPALSATTTDVMEGHGKTAARSCHIAT